MHQQTKAKVTYGRAVARTQHAFLFADKFAVGPPLKSPYFGARLRYKADAELYPPLFGISVLQLSCALYSE